MNTHEFNEAIEVLRNAARSLAPDYEIVNREVNPEEFKTLQTLYQNGKRFPVSAMHNTSSIFGAESNLNFRAWHDACHFKSDSPFTAAGENDTYCLQRKELIRWMRNEEITLEVQVHALNILYVEIMGQLKYQQETGGFPENQVQFTLHTLGIVD